MTTNIKQEVKPVNPTKDGLPHLDENYLADLVVRLEYQHSWQLCTKSIYSEAASAIERLMVAGVLYKPKTEPSDAHLFFRSELRVLQNVCDGDNERFLNHLADTLAKNDNLIEELRNSLRGRPNEEAT